MLLGLLNAGAGFAEVAVSQEIEKSVPVQSTRNDVILDLIRPTLDGHLAFFEASRMKFQDLRISPAIRNETSFEVPVEMSFLLVEDQLPTYFKNLEETSKGKLVAEPRSVNISVSAENTPAGKPLLHFTSVLSLNNAGNGKVTYHLPMFEALLKTTTFTPKISKKITGVVASGEGTWITNLRVDSDQRVMMTGYATDAKQVNQLCRDLEKSGCFAELWLSSLTRNVYEKQPVMRFDISGKVLAATRK